MSEDIETQDIETTESTETATSDAEYLETLKKRADTLGITYRSTIGIEKLKAKIRAKMEGTEGNIENNTKDTTQEQSAEPGPITAKPVVLTKAQLIAQRKRKASELVRVVVACMNPNKKEWEGEIISVGSSKMGTFKKYVPFNVDSGYHVPRAILETLQERKCTVFVTKRMANGDKVRKGKLIPEFSVRILDNLTEKELADLAKQQAMSGSIVESE